MLINTVVLFLRDVLPIFVLISLLSAHYSLKGLWLVLPVIIGLVFNTILVEQLHVISNFFDGAGLELSLFTIHLGIYLLALSLALLSSLRSQHNIHTLWIATSIIILTFITNGTNFVLYFRGYLDQSNALQPMLVGSLLGIGICLSLMTLLYLFAIWLKHHLGIWFTHFFILVYTSGQLVNSLPLLEQIDYLKISDDAWSTQHIISNQSELGYLFKVLFGYQAVPSINQIILYSCVLILSFAVCWKIKISTTNLGNKP